MNYHYSPTANAFFVSGLHPDIPADVVPISEEEHTELMLAQQKGHTIVPGAGGRPEAVAPSFSLEDACKEARAILRDKRKEVEYGGFYLEGQRWDSSEKDELRLNSAGRLFDSGVPAIEGWKISEGVYITLTKTILDAAAIALMQHYARAFAVEAAKLAEIDALQSVKSVEAWLETQLLQGWQQQQLVLSVQKPTLFAKMKQVVGFSA